MHKIKVNGHIYEDFDLMVNSQYMLKTDDLQSVINDFKSATSIVEMNEIGQIVNTVTGVIRVSSIALVSNYYSDSDGVARDAIRVDLVVADINERVQYLEDKIGDNVNESKMSLEEYKAYKIAQSKQALADYLESHPLRATVHNGKEGVYSITKEKQDLLTQNYMSYQLEKVLNPEGAHLTWNESGEVCEPWTEEEFVALLILVKETVYKLVAKQQEIECLIKNSNDKAEIAKVDFDFASVDIRNVPVEQDETPVESEDENEEEIEN